MLDGRAVDIAGVHSPSLMNLDRYGGAYQLASSAMTPLTGRLFRSFSIKVSASYEACP